MENSTFDKYFHILAFSGDAVNKPLISSVFFLIYLIGILINSSVVTVIYLEPHLHTPMYLFLLNLSFVDMCFTTVTVPKLLDILLSGNNIVSLMQCFTQMNFFVVVAITEDILILIMAYDRYVAICIPLHYHRILSKRNCTILTIGIWVTACINSVVLTVSVLHMTSCHSNIIHQFFCDVKSLTKISCRSTGLLYIVVSLEILVFGLGPFLCSLMSYIKIIMIILRIKSKDGRRKSFSTCSSHLTVIIMFYVTSILEYMMPSSEYFEVLELVFTMFYTTVTPMLNPIIYSLQNTDLKRSLQRLMGAKKL